MIYKNLNEIYGTVLKIDIDRKRLSFFTFKSIQHLSRFYTLQKIIIKRSSSKKGRHIILGIKEKMTDYQILTWQLIIGSDKKRERYNLLRLLHGNDLREWNILFNKKINKPIKF